MVQDEILDDIRTVFSSVAGVDPAEVTPEKSLTGDLGIDSMTMLEAVVALEDRFGVLIPDDAWARFSTVGDLVTHLESVGIGTPT
jgi:acyl carrier protein